MLTQKEVLKKRENGVFGLSHHPTKKRRPGSWFDRYANLLFPAPAIGVILLIIIFPIGYTLYMSVQQWQIASVAPPKFIGLDNYVKIIFDDTAFREALFRTLFFTALAVVVQTSLGLALALIFNREFWGRGFLRSLSILPMVATPVAVALIFVIMFNPQSGVLNYLADGVGLPHSLWTYDPSTVLPALVLVDTWEWTPLLMLIILAGLSTLPAEPYEAARIDGASPLQSFIYLTLPLLRPTLTIAILFRLIDALKTFDIIYVMTGGGPGESSQTVNLYLYNQAFSYFDMGYASALVVVFFSVILGISLLVMKFRRTSWA